MSRARMHLVAIRPEIWDHWPADRPLRLLAADIRSLARRIQKGADAAEDRRRITFLSIRFDDLIVRQLGSNPSTVSQLFVSQWANVYLKLREASNHRRTDIRHIFLPGSEVLLELDAMNEVECSKIFDRAADVEIAEKLIAVRKEFLSTAQESQAAVVEVLSFK